MILYETYRSKMDAIEHANALIGRGHVIVVLEVGIHMYEVWYNANLGHYSAMTGGWTR